MRVALLHNQSRDVGMSPCKLHVREAGKQIGSR